MLAKLQRALDGDTYCLLVAPFGSFEHRARIDHYRLAGWMAREKFGVNSGAQYAADKTLIRVSGIDAWHIAEAILTSASKIEVYELGLDSFGRIVADVVIDGQPLGHALATQHAVIAGEHMGIDGRPIRSQLPPSP